MNSKKIMRGLTAACLSAAMLLQPVLAAAPAIPAGWQNPFRDVAQDKWYTPFIANLHANGIVSGYDAHTFGPEDRSYTDQATLMIVKAAGSGTLTVAPGEHWAEPYARYALERGWYTRQDYPADLKRVANRREIGYLAARALHLPIKENAPSPFADVNDPYLTALYHADILVGVKQNGKRCYLPEHDLTRGELSTVVWKIMEYNKKIHYRDQVLDIRPDVPAARWDRDLFRLNGDRMSYAGPGTESVLGVDVSHHQGDIQWNKVAQDGIEFAMIRVGGRGYGASGNLFIDKKFEQNIKGAQDAGLDVGVYFFSQAVNAAEAREEARYVLDQLKGKTIQGPVVFDWEYISYDTARTDGVNGRTMTDMAQAFCGEIEQAGYKAMIYTNQDNGYMRFDLSRLKEYPLWLAEYNKTPSFYYDYALWQYTEKGKVDGISGTVDLNIWPRAL